MVRLSCRYGLSYRGLEEMLIERGRSGGSLHELPIGAVLRPRADTQTGGAKVTGLATGT